MTFKAVAGIDFKSCEKKGKVKYCRNCTEQRQHICEAEVNGTKPPKSKKSQADQWD